MKKELSIVFFVCILCTAFNHRSKYAGTYKGNWTELNLYKNGTYSFLRVVNMSSKDCYHTGTWRFYKGHIVLNSFDQPTYREGLTVIEKYSVNQFDSISFKYFFISDDNGVIDTANFVNAAIVKFEINNSGESYMFPVIPDKASIKIKRQSIKSIIFRLLGDADYPLYFVKNKNANVFEIYENETLQDTTVPLVSRYNYFTNRELEIHGDTLVLDQYEKLVKKDNSNDL